MGDLARASPAAPSFVAAQRAALVLVATFPLGGCDLLPTAPPDRMLHDCIGLADATGGSHTEPLSLAALIDGMKVKGSVGWSSTADSYILHVRFRDALTGKVDTLDVQLHEAANPDGPNPRCGPGVAVITEAAWDGQTFDGMETGMFMSTIIRGLPQSQGASE